MEGIKCKVKKCKREGDLIFYGKEVCNKHWLMDCNKKSRFDLKKEFGIKEEET